MKDQSCKPCAEGRYSLGTGIRFDEWDELPHGFASLSTNMEIEDSTIGSTGNCTSSKWVPLGDYISSNTDECTATLMYAVNLKQSGTVNFEYYYPDSSIIFEFFVQNDQCQPNADDSRWMKTTEKGWEFHSVELNRGNNVLYWRTTAFSVWSKVSKPVLVRNIAITGVAYTSECFPCKPGTYADKQGSSFCKLCPANTYSNKGETSCHQCDPDKYSGDVSVDGESLVGDPTHPQGETGSGAILFGQTEGSNSEALAFWVLEEPYPTTLHSSLLK
uniref:Endosome-lysosome associated apoptosis and autophagy regulator 1 n=1 Tax=Sus scrofa TaxID=9823 RepID=A0A8D0YJ95_PIG